MSPNSLKGWPLKIAHVSFDEDYNCFNLSSCQGIFFNSFEIITWPWDKWAESPLLNCNRYNGQTNGGKCA